MRLTPTFIFIVRRSMLTACLAAVLFLSHAQICTKVPFKQVNYIVNPSFEQVVGSCQVYLSGTNAASLPKYIPGWTLPYTRYSAWYVGSCNNYIIDPPFPVFPKVPMPMPDGGDGALLVQDSPNGAKNYMGNCLTQPLTKDQLYRLKFSLGFGSYQDFFDTIQVYSQWPKTRTQYPSPERITIFGYSDCITTPLDTKIVRADCPTRLGSGWVELGNQIVYSDSGKWAEGVIDFKVPHNISYIAIGASCDRVIPDTSTKAIFYYLDNLRLYQSVVSKPLLAITDGSRCNGPSAFAKLQVMNASDYTGSDFQWFRNDVSIPEKSSSLVLNKNNYGPGWYQFRVQNDSVCLRSDSLYIDWVAAPDANMIGAKDTTACVGDVVTLDVTTQGAAYLWQDNSTDPIRKVTESGSYKVTIANICDTINIAKQFSFVKCPATFFVPTAFTPNGDGLNDVFRPRLKGSVTSYQFTIFNRVGYQLFSTNDPAKGWDGMVARVKQDAGVYVWLLTYTDGDGNPFTKNGTMVLMR